MTWKGCGKTTNGTAGCLRASAVEAAVVRMWKAGTNEDGKPLSRLEWQALAERWCQLFGFAPPTEPAGVPSPQESEPEDTTTINMKEVVRLTGLSESTIERLYKVDKFPKPMQLSARRIGWNAGKVKAWKAERELQRLRASNCR